MCLVLVIYMYQCGHYENLPMQYTDLFIYLFSEEKMEKFIGKKIAFFTGELIVYTCSGIRPSSVVVHNFKDFLNFVWSILRKGNESLYKWSRSHDQDGRHGYK